MVAPWIKQMTEDVIGGSLVEIGKYYTHPEDGLIEIIAGQWWGEHGLSNHWSWRVVETGETHHGYAARWPETDYEKCGTTTPNWPLSPCEYPKGHGRLTAEQIGHPTAIREGITADHKCGKVYWDEPDDHS